MDSGSINGSSSNSCWTACCCSCPQQQQQQGVMGDREVSPAPSGGEPQRVVDTQPRSVDPQTDLDDRNVVEPATNLDDVGVDVYV